MLRVAVLAAAAALLPLSNVQAQTTNEPSGLVQLDFASNGLSFASSPAAAAQAGQTAPPRGFFIKAFFGGWFSAGEGVVVGGGASFMPFTNKQHEVGANFSYLHVSETDGWMLEFNYHYNFAPQDAGFTPFVTAGLNIAHHGGDDVCDDIEDITDTDQDCSATDAGLQVGGGIKKSIGRFDLFGELLFVLSEGEPIIVRGGLIF